MNVLLEHWFEPHVISGKIVREKNFVMKDQYKRGYSKDKLTRYICRERESKIRLGTCYNYSNNPRL